MIIFNNTFKVDKEIAEAWLEWQFKEHIPEVMSTKLFDDFKVFKLLDQHDEDGNVYIIQYYTETKKITMIILKNMHRN